MMRENSKHFVSTNFISLAELTVRHLRKLKMSGRLGLTRSGERFRAGYSYCAGEISRFVTSPGAGLDMTASARLLHHLSVSIRNLETLHHPSDLLETLRPPSDIPVQSPPPLLSPSSDLINTRFSLGRDLVGSDREEDKAWRPW